MSNQNSSSNKHILETDLEKLGVTQYAGPIPFEELPFPDTPMSEDYEWADKDLELKKQYRGNVVAVQNKIVWGVGRTHQEAWQDAQTKSDCPTSSELVFVYIC